MNKRNNILSYINILSLNLRSCSDSPLFESLSNSDSAPGNVDSRYDKEREKTSVGPYEVFFSKAFKSLDGQLDRIFNDKAKYIKSIAKLRAFNDVEHKQPPLCSFVSSYSSLFGSLDLCDFFSSIDPDKIRKFLKSYSSFPSSFISSIRDCDLKGKAFMEIRSKLNSLACLDHDGISGLSFEFINLLSLMYYISVISLLIGKGLYGDYYAYSLLNVISKLKKGEDGGFLSYFSDREKSLLECMKASAFKYA